MAGGEIPEKLRVAECIKCGLCSYVCPSGRRLTEYIGPVQKGRIRAKSSKTEEDTPGAVSYTQRDVYKRQIRKSPLAGKIKIKEENSGLHFLMELQTKMPDDLLEEKAGRMGLRISCLSAYYHQPEQAKQHVLVLNYSGIDREKMAEAIEILERCVNVDD